MNIKETNKINAHLAKFNKLSAKHRTFVIEYCRKGLSVRMAAEASGYSPDNGWNIRNRPEVAEAIDDILAQRLEASEIDVEWALMAAVDQRELAMQQGNVSAANTALGHIMKHTMVDAVASDKINVNIHADEQLLSKLQRGRIRNAADDDAAGALDDEVDFF